MYGMEWRKSLFAIDFQMKFNLVRLISLWQCLNRMLLEPEERRMKEGVVKLNSIYFNMANIEINIMIFLFSSTIFSLSLSFSSCVLYFYNSFGYCVYVCVRPCLCGQFINRWNDQHNSHVLPSFNQTNHISHTSFANSFLVNCYCPSRVYTAYDVRNCTIL